MRPDIRLHARSPRTVAVGMSAVAGSIALMLGAAPPAQAASERSEGTARPELPALRAVPAAHLGHAAAPQGTRLAALRVATAAAPETYTVQRGDTVWGIATRHGLRTADVLALNGLTSSSIIYPGQVLRLTGAAAAAPAPTAPSTPAPTGTSYTVQAGDTVSAIARRHGVSTNAVLNANGLGWSSIIYPGQSLTIPGMVPAASTSPAPAAPQPPAAPPASTSGAYTVRAGDTVSAIAKHHGLSTQAVLDANGLGWSSIIYPGQSLSIPVGNLPGLDAEQSRNARLIVRVGRDLGVPDRGIAIALGAAMQESWIRNLDWGDRDSLGLFQQRPSTGWGTAAEILDPVRSIKAFYGGPADPNGSRTRGLLDIAGWESMSFTQAAQAVQISAYPDRYAQWEKSAYAWLAAAG